MFSSTSLVSDVIKLMGARRSCCFPKTRSSQRRQNKGKYMKIATDDSSINNNIISNSCGL